MERNRKTTESLFFKYNATLETSMMNRDTGKLTEDG
jgi:hypothetical protein